MPRLKVNIKTGYGDLEISGDSPEELLEGLTLLTKNYVAQINEKASELLAAHAEDELKDILRVGKEGPVIITMEELSHYESIGLVLYAIKDHQATSREIKELLLSSGKKVTVGARLHEMRDRGQIFKPSLKGSEYKLTTKGMRWLEEEVIPRLRTEED
jgi:hypothetical protein